MGIHSLKLKFILIAVICILVVCMSSNFYLYNRLDSLITDKAERIHDLYLDTARDWMEDSFREIKKLGSLCESDEGMAQILIKNEPTGELSEIVRLRLGDYISANKLGNYIEELLIFNDRDVEVHANALPYECKITPEKVRALPLFQTFFLSEAPTAEGVFPSMKDPGVNNLGMISRVHDSTGRSVGYVYIEVDCSFIPKLLVNREEEQMFVTTADDHPLPHNSSVLPENISPLPQEGKMLTYGRSDYLVSVRQLSVAGLKLYGYSDATFLTHDRSPMIYIIVMTITAAALTGVLLVIMLSGLLVNPLKRLTRRIRRISDNDFSYDPSIEKGQSEIAEVGRVVNEMSASIVRLMQEMEEMHAEQKNAEIALLQSQVNPHFLYNTLDSIHWMATIQKNVGIAQMTHSLSILLRNLAKGTGEKVELGVELDLLKAYVEIQALRYMESFRFENKIDESLYSYKLVKFTLQPLVENAIFHGIEPTGMFGTITLSAREEGDSLLIMVEDDGVGMDAEELARLMEERGGQSKSSLSGIGVFNVNRRLRLTYGEGYGLQYESVKGEYTRVTVRIPKEK